ncbi:MAG: exonuclease domain-containing protein, partial [Simkaniaceae bacterium]|nr:exonuclease domain-containing protein [Simkaniaceae bacterium]
MIGIFLDSETNGLNPHNHRIIDIAFRLIDLESGDEIASFSSIVYQNDDIWEKSNPDSLAINGFTREMAMQGRREDDVAADIKKIFEKHEIDRSNSVFICQNPSFDRIFFSQLISPDLQEELNWPYHWLDLASMHWGRLMTSGTAL